MRTPCPLGPRDRGGLIGRQPLLEDSLYKENKDVTA